MSASPGKTGQRSSTPGGLARQKSLKKQATAAALTATEDGGGAMSPVKSKRSKSEALVPLRIETKTPSNADEGTTPSPIPILDWSGLSGSLSVKAEDDTPLLEGTAQSLLQSPLENTLSGVFGRVSVTSPNGQEQGFEPDSPLSPKTPKTPETAGSGSPGSKRMKLMTNAPLKQRYVFYFVTREWLLSLPPDEPMPFYQELLKAGKLKGKEFGITDILTESEELRKYAVVSYRWRSQHQPDPGGGNMLPLLQEAVKNHPDVEYLWLDWTSVPQLTGLKKRRKEKDEVAYEATRRSIHILYLTLTVFVVCDRRCHGDLLACYETWMAMQVLSPLGVRPAHKDADRTRAIFLWDDAVTPIPYDESVQGALAMRVGFGNLVSNTDKLSRSFGNVRASVSPCNSARNNSFSSQPGVKFSRSGEVALTPGATTPRGAEVSTDPIECVEDMVSRWAHLSVLAAKINFSKLDFAVGDEKEKTWLSEVLTQLRTEVAHLVRELDRGCHAGGGMLTDALERARALLEIRSSPEKLLARDEKELLFGLKQLKREQLQSKLSWLWQSSQGSRRETGQLMESWRAAARKISRFHGQAKGFKFQVDFFYLQLRMRNTLVREVEAPDERSNRLEQFWRHYHTEVKREQYYKTANLALPTPVHVPKFLTMNTTTSLLSPDGGDTRRMSAARQSMEDFSASFRRASFRGPARISVAEPDVTFLPATGVEDIDSANAWKIRNALPRRLAEARQDWLRPDITTTDVEAEIAKASQLPKSTGLGAKKIDWRRAPAAKIKKQTRACERDEAWLAQGELARSPAWSLPGVDRRPKSESLARINTGRAARPQFFSSPAKARSTLFHARSTPVVHDMTQAKVWTPKAFSGKLEERTPCNLPYQSVSPAIKDQSLPSNLYLRACEERKILPVALPFITGHSTRLHAKGQALADETVLAITAMITSSSVVDEIDLEGNCQLTDRSLVTLLQKFAVKPAGAQVARLCLRGCLRTAAPLAVESVLDMVVKLMHLPTGMTQLTHLDLSEVPISYKGQLNLCKAIRFHPKLRDVYLSAIGLGLGQEGPECMTDLMYSRSLNLLDLSWNSLTEECFKQLGQAQVNMRRLRSLSLAHCSSHAPSVSQPLDHFIEFLSQDRTLTALDISGNFLDQNSALVIEDALGMHQSLHTLIAADNPLGVLGIRSMMRLLSHQESHVQHVSCEGCYGGGPTDATAAGGNKQVFSGSMPQGRYELAMAWPHNRALLRMLLKACERLNLPASSIFSNVSWVGSPSFDPRTASKNSLTRVWEVPSHGALSFSFSMQAGLNAVLQGVADYDFPEVIARFEAATRLRPSFQKLLPLLSTWKSLENMEVEQATILKALSRDLAFTCEDLRQMCTSNRSACLEVLSFLLPCMTEGRPGLLEQHLATSLMPSFATFTKLYISTQGLLHFNLHNVTGKYRLILENPADHAVAQRLIVLDRWEAVVAARKGLTDTSQRGNRAAIRNETYQDYSLRYLPSMEEFVLPESGTFALDYASRRRPPAGVTAVPDDLWKRMLLAIQWADLSSEEDIVLCLRELSHCLWLSTWQARMFLELLEDQDNRLEAFVILYERIVDMYNERVLRSCFTSREATFSLRRRLGHATYFPFLQPELSFFELDLSMSDERLATHMLSRLRSAEDLTFQDCENFRGSKLVGTDGSVEKLEQGPPKDWDRIDNIPTSGIFKAQYYCKWQNRKLGERCSLYADAGHWPKLQSTDAVQWCGDMTDVHPRLWELVCFVLARFPTDSADPFRRMLKGIDSSGKTHSLSFDNFIQGLRVLHCQKFRKVSEIREVFQAVQGGDGNMTEVHWIETMRPLVAAARLCLASLRSFLERTCEGGLDLMWREIDEAGIGNVTAEQWIRSLQDLGYYGHSKLVFMVLDVEARGSISSTEFAMLDTLVLAEDLRRSTK